MKSLRFWPHLLGIAALLILLSARPSRANEHTDVALDPAEGRIAQDTVFTVSFPGPMIPPGRINAADAAPPIAFQPNLDGAFRWKSVADGEFTITGPLAPGTHYRVSTESGLKDDQGRAVPSQKWEFDSDAFDVTTDDEPRDALSARPHFALHANYPVSLLDAAEAVYFQDRDSHERLPVEILVEAAQSIVEQTDFTVIPRKPLPANHTYDVVVNGLRDAHSHAPLAYMHVFGAGETSPINVQWVGAFNEALQKPIVRMKFSEQIDPESVTADAVSFTPPAPGLKLHADQDELVAEGAFDIKQHYVAVISTAVKGIRGFGLAAPSKWGATFHPKDSDVIFPEGEIFQRSASGLKFSLLQVNTGPLTWTLSEVPLARLPQIAERVKQYKAGEPALDLKLAAQGQFDANDGVEEVLREIDWHPPQPLNGAYLLEVTAPATDGGKAANRSLVCFSEYLLTQKRAEGQTILRVARMSDGLGAPNLPVRVLTSESVELGRAVTNGNGVAEFANAQLFPEKMPPAQVFVADTPTGPSIQYVEGPTLSSAEYHRPETSATLRSIVVTDRNLYRPGQTVKMHGLVRVEKKGALSLPDFKEATWQIRNEGGDPVTEGAVPLGAHGTWDGEWAIPSTLATGVYRIRCAAGDLAGEFTEFRVEEYRVPLFSVVVDRIDAPGPVSQVKVSSAYFHGAPNARAKVHWKAVWSTAQLLEGRDDGFVHSDAHSENRIENDEDKEAQGDAVLDENGAVTLRCEPPYADGRKRGRCSVAWVVDVTSAEAQTLTGSVESRIQFADAWAGIRAEPKAGAERTIEVECEALNVRDEAVKGTSVTVDLFHVSSKTVREKIAPFVVRYRNTSQFEKVASQVVATPAKFDFQVGEPGEYVAVAIGPAEIPVSASITVSGDEQAELPIANDTEIALSVPEPVRPYAPGEVVPIAVQAPFGGVAWVSVEAGEILDTLIVPLGGNAGRIDLPIKPEYAPNATVTVYLVQPGGNARLPRERIGELRIDVQRPDRDLVVTPKLASSSVRPGAAVHCEFTVTSERHPVAGADFLVFAVDDAVLQLGDWKMPDCKAAFYPERGHGVSTFAALSRFFDKIDRRSLQQKGYVVGDGGEGAAGSLRFVRKEFKTLAYWQSNLTTDANGKISVDFEAPDNLTSYRVVAIGNTDSSQFGAGTATFAVSKPLLCESALPRFVRVGDAVQLRAVARQKPAKNARITVRCTAEGLDFDDPKPVTKDAPQDVPAVFGFSAHVRDGSPVVTVRFEATSDIGESDAVEVTLPVKPPTVLRRESVEARPSFPVTPTSPPEGAASPFGVVTLHPLEFAPKLWQTGHGSFEVAVSTSPWLSKLTALPAILDYPHGCFEQISSRILAYSMMADLLASLPDWQGRDANYRSTITEGLKRFEDGLLADGMLPYWPGSPTPDSFVTVQAAWAAREAEQAGIDVPLRLKEQLAGALQKIVAGTGGAANSVTRALALAVVARPDAVEGDATVAEDLYLKRDRLSDEGRALLAIALQRFNIMPKEKGQLLKEIAKPVAERAFDPGTFTSTTRAEAMITLAFAEADPKSPQVKQRNDRLLKLMDSSASLSTQENLWLLLAFKALHHARPLKPLEPNSMTPAPTLLSKDATGAAWPSNDLASLKSFAVKGLPPGVTCLLSAEYRTDDPDTDRSDRGLRIERVVRDLADVKRTGNADAPFKLGDQILVTYRVLGRARQNYVALEDLLPAGLETVNPNLPLVAKTFQLPPDPGGRELDLSHSELRDDATRLYFDRLDAGPGVYSVLARATGSGTFHWPATQVAPMYDSRFTGLSASSSCVIEE